MKRVLVGFNQGVSPKPALELLGRLPAFRHAGIVVAPIEIRAHGTSQRSAVIDELANSAGQLNILREELSLHFPRNFDAQVHPLSCLNNPGQTIVDFAHANDCDLIVLPGDSTSYAHQQAFTSLRDFVCANARCSVMVARQQGDATDAIKPTSNEVSSIQLQRKQQRQDSLHCLVGCDGSRRSAAAVQEIADLTRGSDAPVHLVGVIGQSTCFAGAEESNSARLEQTETDLSRRKRDFEQSVAINGDHRVSSHVVQSGHIGEGIIRFANDHGCGLVVLGECPRHMVGRVLMGSVSRYVLRHADCSVLIARNRVAGAVKPDKLAIA